MYSQWPSSTIVTADPRVVSCELEQERVLLDLSSSRYFSLNKVGNHVWEIIATPTRVGDIQQKLRDRFDVPVERCRADLETLLTQLSAAQLIGVQHGHAA